MASIADALRHLRTAKKLSQSAAGRLPGSPDHRTISHWETDRKLPSLRLLRDYLDALKLDFHDLQDALDHTGVAGTTAARLDEISAEVERLAHVVTDIADRQLKVERHLENAAGRLTARLNAIEPDQKRAVVIERRLSALERQVEDKE